MKLAKIFKGDKGIWVIFFLLSIVSLLAVYSSIGLYAYSAFASKTPTTLFLRHFAIVLASYIVVLVLSNINYRYFSRFAALGYWLSLAMLVLMLLLSKGRWFHIPVIGQFQPSEIAKVFLIVFVARYMALKKNQVEELGTFLMPLLYIMFTAVLVLPDNFSTAALIFISAYMVLYLGGVRRSYWWRFLAIVVVVVGVAMFVMLKTGDSIDVLERSDTWVHRVDRWLHPQYDELSQENMAKMAIARGGVVRFKIGSTVHARLMTQAHNDFIYAIIIEETGLLGGLAVFVLYGAFFLRCIRLASRCKGRFGALTVAGLGTLIFLQALVNMCVAVGVLPVTGQTLPFISYGGTAYLSLSVALGVIQSVAADVIAQEKREKTENTTQEPLVINPSQTTT